MVASIPFFEMRMVTDGVLAQWGSTSVVIPTFGIPVDPWATLVCLGILIGMEWGRYRCIKMGLSVRDLIDGVIVTILLGFFFAHVITVVAYYPERLTEDGIWAILRVWEGFSSTGGFVGAFIGMPLWFLVLRHRFYPLWDSLWRRLGFNVPNETYEALTLSEFGRFADLIAFGFPLGWLFGRLGCAVVHDHVGMPTSFALGMAFPEGHWAAGVRHELGFYEFLAMIPMVALFAWLGRKDQPNGTFMGLFFLVYAPLRFVLDFYRNVDLAVSDARYFGLTPAQYGMIALGLFGLVLFLRRDRDAPAWPLDGQPDQAARAT